MRARVAALVVAVAPALSGVGLAQPIRLVRGAPSASASSSSPRAHHDVGFAPDPTPLVTRAKWVYELSFVDGAFTAAMPTRRELSRPTETERRMGRYMLEIYVGPVLLERVRFEVPLQNGDPWSGAKRRPFDAPPDLARRVRVKLKVEVPDSERVTSAAIVDRATGHKTRLPWPRTPPAQASSAPAPAASVSAR